MKDIYSLKMNEAVNIDDFTRVRRVPSGWIYTNYDKEVTSVFVPYYPKGEHNALLG
jgi:hypothetical protein